MRFPEVPAFPALRAGFVLSSIVAMVVVGCKPAYEYTPGQLPDTFDAYYQNKLELSEQDGVRPGNNERLVRYGDRTDLVLLYIHGFGASRAEAEFVIDPIARELQANTYYARLPGHGANMDVHADARFEQYVVLAEEAFAMSRKLGDKVIIMGTSTGALLATYLAARYPDQVAGTVLVSPFYDFISGTSVLLAVPGGLSIIHAVSGGEVRDAGWGDDPEQRKVEGYDDYWLTKQKFSALVELDKVRRYIAHDDIYRKVTSPVLLLHYYKDEEHQDNVASVPAMREAFAAFGKAGAPSPLNRMVAVEDSNHIMLSEYVRSDKETPARAIREFLRDVQGQDQPANEEQPEAPAPAEKAS
jgi:pimeloyl-ACP methyl ester carboxylesterase